MEFSPFNNVVKRCLQGMDMEEKGKPEEALQLLGVARGAAQSKNDLHLS